MPSPPRHLAGAARPDTVPPLTRPRAHESGAAPERGGGPESTRAETVRVSDPAVPISPSRGLLFAACGSEPAVASMSSEPEARVALYAAGFRDATTAGIAPSCRRAVAEPKLRRLTGVISGGVFADSSRPISDPEGSPRFAGASEPGWGVGGRERPANRDRARSASGRIVPTAVARWYCKGSRSPFRTGALPSADAPPATPGSREAEGTPLLFDRSGVGADRVRRGPARHVRERVHPAGHARRLRTRRSSAASPPPLRTSAAGHFDVLRFGAAERTAVCRPGRQNGGASGRSFCEVSYGHVPPVPATVFRGGQRRTTPRGRGRLVGAVGMEAAGWVRPGEGRYGGSWCRLVCEPP